MSEETKNEEAQEEPTVGVGMLVAAFTDENAAEGTFKAIKQAQKERGIRFEEAAVIRQDADGDVHYTETGDMTAGKGAGIGALVGGVIGILGGPAGIAIGAGAGALVGGLAAKGDAGYDDASLKELGVALQPGTSAIVVITSSLFLKAMRTYGDKEQMREAVTNLSQGISAHLAEGNNVALALIITEKGVAVKEVVANEESAHVIGAVATEEGWAAAEALVTEEGVAVQRFAGTDKVVAGEGVVVTEEGAVAGGFVATEDEAVAGVAAVIPEEEEENKED